MTERRQAESELERLAGEQAALRRVAMLVAREGSQAEVFEAIADECAQLFGTQEMRLVRFDESPSPSEFVVAGLGKSAEYLPVGSRQPLAGENMTTRVFRTGRLARIDDYRGNGERPDRRGPEGGWHSVDHRRADHGRGTALGRDGCRAVVTAFCPRTPSPA